MKLLVLTLAALVCLSHADIECPYVEGQQACQNFFRPCEKLINEQVTMELSASYVYLAMATFFQKTHMARHGFTKFFMDASHEEREHAEKFLKYLNDRGARTELGVIPAPTKQEWTSGQDAMEDALALERKVNAALLRLHKRAQDTNDPHLQNFLEGEFLEEQVRSIKQLSDHVTQLKRMAGNELAEHLFDMRLLDGKKSTA